jgi:hypothetical protein
MIIRVASDSGDPLYDFFVEADDSVYSLVEAIDKVDAAIRQAKTAHPEDYQFEDLVDALPEGIRPANISTANEEW